MRSILAAPSQWIPIRTLAARHRRRILAHLMALPEADRYARFGYAASDAQLEHYVDLIDFSRDEVFGIFNWRLELVGMAHLAMFSVPQGTPTLQGEFGVSVLPRGRGRGFGTRLFRHAVTHARNRHIDTLVIHALRENRAMLHIARQAGARIDLDRGEAMGLVRLAPHSLQSHVDEMLASHGAELNYHFKVQRRRLRGALATVGHFAGMGRTSGGE